MAPTNHWKLGLFVVNGVVLGLLTLVILGSQTLQKQTTSYKTYFDESVQVMQRIAREEGRLHAHSVNDPRIIAGAGTMTLEILEQAG